MQRKRLSAQQGTRQHSRITPDVQQIKKTKSRSEKWPGNGIPVVFWCRENPLIQQGLSPLSRSVDLFGGDVLNELLPQVSGERVRQNTQLFGDAVGEGLSDPTPQHRAQLGFGVQTDTVVYPVNPTIAPVEKMPALAIGVVHDDVQRRKLA